MATAVSPAWREAHETLLLICLSTCRKSCSFSWLCSQNQGDTKASAKEEGDKTPPKGGTQVSMKIETGCVKMLLSPVCYVITRRAPTFTLVPTVLCVLALSI